MAKLVVDKIQIPASAVPGESPPAGLLEGELWVNTADKILFAGATGGTAVLIGDLRSIDGGTY